MRKGTVPLKAFHSRRGNEKRRAMITVACLLSALVVGAAPVTPPVTAQSEPRWTVTQPMHMARDGATITVLPSGDVLVVGGSGPHGPLVSAEIYRPRARLWARTGSLHAARDNHTATLLRDGQVLVAGGSDASNVLSSAELYDPRAARWTSTRPMRQARSGHTATLLSNGEVLVVGGASQNVTGLASAEIFNARTGRWRGTGRLITGRSGHRAILLPTGSVLVIGGDHADSADTLASAEAYIPRTGLWTRVRSMLYPRDYFTATLLRTGRVLIAGTPGTRSIFNCSLRGHTCPYPPDAELYNPQIGTSIPTGQMTTLRSQHTATLLADGTVLVTGGNGNTCGNANCPWTASTEIYRPQTNRWTAARSMHQARIDSLATLLHDGTILVAGGRAANELSSAEIYNP